MDWGDCVDLVEIVDGSDIGIKGGEIAAHGLLGVDGPGGALAALGVVWVEEFRIVARWLQGVATLEFETREQWLEEVLGGVVVGLFIFKNLPEEANHFLSDSLMSSFLLDLRLEVAVCDAGREHRGIHEGGVGHTLQSDDGELVGLGVDDVFGLVPVGLGAPGDSEETVLLADQRQGWGDSSLELGPAFVGEGSRVSQQNTSHQDLTFNIGP